MCTLGQWRAGLAAFGVAVVATFLLVGSSPALACTCPATGQPSTNGLCPNQTQPPFTYSMCSAGNIGANLQLSAAMVKLANSQSETQRNISVPNYGGASNYGDGSAHDDTGLSLFMRTGQIASTAQIDAGINHLGMYTTGSSSDVALGAGGYSARNYGYGVSDTAGILAPGSTTPTSRETGGGGGVTGSYDASNLVGPAQTLIVKGSFNYEQTNTIFGAFPGAGTGAGSTQHTDYGFTGSAVYTNNNNYLSGKVGYSFGRGSEFMTVDGSSGSFGTNGYFVDATAGHVFILVNTINTASPMYNKAPVKPADGYALGLDLSGHIGYQSNQDNGFVDSVGFVYGTERVLFGDGGLQAKLMAQIPRGSVTWVPYVGVTGDWQFGFSHTFLFPVQAALPTGDVVNFTQGTSAVGAQLGLDARWQNGWIVGVNGFYSHTSNIDIAGGKAFLKIPFGPAPVVARY